MTRRRVLVPMFSTLLLSLHLLFTLLLPATAVPASCFHVPGASIITPYPTWKGSTTAHLEGQYISPTDRAMKHPHLEGRAVEAVHGARVGRVRRVLDRHPQLGRALAPAHAPLSSCCQRLLEVLGCSVQGGSWSRLHS